MNVLNHVGLFGDFSNCESGLIPALNRNFLVSDSIMQMNAKDFVVALPVAPSAGDVYLYDDGTSNKIIIYSGTGWVYLTPQTGYICYVESDDNFYFYDMTGAWQLWSTTAGDVYGPGSAVANNIVIFDGTTGKLIKDSGVSVSDINAILLDLQDQIDNIDPLPSQTGQSGKILSTNGTIAIWIAAPVGLPVGGTTGQALVKNSGTNYDVSWQTIQSGFNVSAVQSLAASSTITLGAFKMQRVKIKSTGAALVNVTIPNGATDGDVLVVLGYSDTETCVIQNAGNVQSNGDVTFYKGVQVIYMWDAGDTKWYQSGGF